MIWSSRRTAIASRILLSGMMVAAVGCSEKAAPAPTSGAGSAEEVPSYLRADLKTTSPEIAMSNFEGQLRHLRAAAAKKPNDTPTQASLAEALLFRARVLGHPADLEEAIKVGEETHAKDPSLEGDLLHLSVLGAAHRFKEALAELDRIDSQWKTQLRPGQTRMKRVYLLVANGKYAEASVLLDEELSLHRSDENLEMKALILADQGKVDDAEVQFVEAEDEYLDTNPFTITDLYFDRATMWEKQGDLGKARAIYQAARKHLPQQVHVTTHLAALLPPDQAVTLLQPLATDDSDPEVIAALGVAKNLVAAGTGEADIQRAGQSYDALAQALPAAYADHAGWFWLNAGRDPAKALSSAKVNLEQRETAESFDLLLAAADAAHDRTTACQVVPRAKAYPFPSSALRERLAKLDCTK